MVLNVCSELLFKNNEEYDSIDKSWHSAMKHHWALLILSPQEEQEMHHQS